MKNSHKGFALSLLLIIIALLLASGGAYIYEKNKQVNQPVVASPITQATSTTQDANPFPPNGWYVHNLNTSSNVLSNIMLTKQKTVPTNLGGERGVWGEQIGINVSMTTLTAEQYIANIVQDGVYPSSQSWNTVGGYKSFRMEYQTNADTTPTDGQYIFVGNKVYEFSLWPSVEKNRNDFQQVVNYYVKNIVR